MLSLTAIILTKNEEENISHCINSIKDIASRIIVIDSGSTDETVNIAKRLGAEVYFNEYQYYAQQFNWGIDNTDITTTWTLRLDADERFTKQLKNEVITTLEKYSNSNVNGITLEAWLYFLNKKIKYGLSNKRKLMIFRTGYGRIEDRKRDAHTILKSGESISLKEKFLHYDFKGIDDFINKYNLYSDFEVFDYFNYKKGANVSLNSDKQIERTRRNKFDIYYKFPKFIRARLWFIFNYYFKLGFLSGKESYIYHYLECYWYRNLVDAKILELEKEDYYVD